MTVTKTEIFFFFLSYTPRQDFDTLLRKTEEKKQKGALYKAACRKKKKENQKNQKTFFCFPYVSLLCVFNSSWEHYSPLLELPLLELVSMMTQKAWRSWNRGSKFSEIQCNSPSQVCAWAHWLAHLAGLGATCECGYLEVLLRQAEWIKKLDFFSLLSFFAVKLDSFIQDRVGKWKADRWSQTDHELMILEDGRWVHRAYYIILSTLLYYIFEYMFHDKDLKYCSPSAW